eukprot:scaffold399_cov112-Isochrysis_galbana.AAC.4
MRDGAGHETCVRSAFGCRYGSVSVSVCEEEEADRGIGEGEREARELCQLFIVGAMASSACLLSSGRLCR